MDAHLTSIRGTAHASMNHPTYETPGRQFVAGLGFKPKRDNLEASVRSSRPSRKPSPPMTNVGRWVPDALLQSRIKLTPENALHLLSPSQLACLSQHSVEKMNCPLREADHYGSASLHQD